MTQRRPLVVVGGKLVQLPVGDTLAGASFPLTAAEYAALEDPPGSGLYPSLAGKSVIITDRYKDNTVIVDVYPDEGNRETISRITANSGTWTVDRDGYVYCTLTISSSAIAGLDCYFYVNGKVREAGCIWQNAISGVIVFSTTMKVKAGDVVSITGTASTGTLTVNGIGCYWEPAIYKVTANPNLNVEIGTDYSTTEQPVMIKDKDTGEIRQKLDVDGSPIWERTFVGNITAAANVMSNVSLLIGVKTFFSPEGVWYRGDTVRYSIGSYSGADLTVPTSTTANGSLVFINASEALLLRTLSARARDGITNSNYRITIRYTKL
jgi:hypothetical protein